MPVSDQGTEDGVPDDELDPKLHALVQAYHRPPDVPREALWARIAAARAAASPANRVAGPRPAFPRLRRPSLDVLVPLGLAAMLALAFGLGRLSVEQSRTPLAAANPSRASLAQQVATAEHLGRVEVFLTDFRAGARAGRADSVASADARRLLALTRLMLDSPGGRDNRVRALLEDLELVLAEIAQLHPRSNADIDLITEGLDRRGTIARLRSAVPAGFVPATQGES
jgi:hypothetical protein